MQIRPAWNNLAFRAADLGAQALGGTGALVLLGGFYLADCKYDLKTRLQSLQSSARKFAPGVPFVLSMSMRAADVGAQVAGGTAALLFLGAVRFANYRDDISFRK